ncbi:MAG TPA: glutathione synthase [Polyangiales bacterium]|nr:glutathione synthase [Polyangiales bacterium]
MRFVVIMDPVSTVLPEADTTFALMEEAQKRGHRIDHCLNTDLILDGGKLQARAAQATLARDAAAPMRLSAAELVSLHDVDAVFVRTDPPFDLNYLWTTQLLETLRGQTLVLNDPRGLQRANEKLYTTYFPELMPETLVTSWKDLIKAFITRVGGHAVIKPLDGRGGEGVLVLREGDPNINAIIEATTKNGQRAAMVQVFLPEVKVGDKRILLLDGEFLGAVLRVPASDEIRSNLRVGGRGVAASLDAQDRAIIERLGPKLREDGLHLVGIDVIGGKLTEVNVTSPTGIQSMTRLDGKNYSAQVIDWVERRAAAVKAGR